MYLLFDACENTEQATRCWMYISASRHEPKDDAAGWQVGVRYGDTTKAYIHILRQRAACMPGRHASTCAYTSIDDVHDASTIYVSTMHASGCDA